MMVKNYYKILGISISATEEEIKDGYHKKAKMYHPDLNHSDDATNMMQDINEAYGVLSSPVNKMQYDFILQNSDFNSINEIANFFNFIFAYACDPNFSKELVGMFKSILEILRDNNARLKEINDEVYDGLGRITDIINNGLDELEKKRQENNDYIRIKKEEEELKKANSPFGKAKRQLERIREYFNDIFVINQGEEEPKEDNSVKEKLKSLINKFKRV